MAAGKIMKNILTIVICLIIANLISAFLLGIFMTIGGNIQVIGLNKLNFDPLITIAYMILYYFLNSFYQPSDQGKYLLFLFTLFLSFTVGFLQGAIFLVLVYLFLKKLKII